VQIVFANVSECMPSLHYILVPLNMSANGLRLRLDVHAPIIKTFNFAQLRKSIFCVSKTRVYVVDAAELFKSFET
jgi:hypothetical protein